MFPWITKKNSTEQTKSTPGSEQEDLTSQNSQLLLKLTY